MNRKKEFLYFILLIMREITSALTGPSLLQYDVTKALNHWFYKILNFDINLTSKDVDSAFEEVQRYRLLNFEFDLEHEVEPFPRKFFFNWVHYNEHSILMHYEPRTVSFSQIDWNLRKNEISVFSEFIFAGIDGFLGFRYPKIAKDRFDANLNFKNFKLRTIGSSKSNSNSSLDISYDCFYADAFKVYNEDWWNNETLQFIARNTLIRELEPAFIAMLKEVLKRKSVSFESAFKSLLSIAKQTNQDVIPTNADIFQEGRKYYYFIPNIQFCCGFTLKTVVIKGLSNIKSLKFYRNPRPFSHSFLMHNVHGSMVLDYERVEEKPLKLDFKIDRLSMSIVRGANNCVIVEAPEFSVNSTSEPLTRRQSAVLVQLIESALVSSLMPSRKVCDVPKDVKVPVAIKLRITEVANDWSKIKKVCQDWIPFNNGAKKMSSKEN